MSALAQQQSTQQPIFLNLAGVRALLGIGKTSVYKLINTDPDFPRPVQITERRVGWRRNEIEEWADNRPHARR